MADVADEYWTSTDGPAVDVLRPLWRMLQSELWRLEALDAMLDVPPVVDGPDLAERLTVLYVTEQSWAERHAALGRSVPQTNTAELDRMSAAVAEFQRYAGEQTLMLRHALEHCAEAVSVLQRYVSDVLSEQSVADTDGLEVEHG